MQATIVFHSLSCTESVMSGEGEVTGYKRILALTSAFT